MGLVVTVALGIVAPSLAADGAASYTALGDSFTAGPGIPVPAKPYGCHRSTNNYPNLLAHALEEPPPSDASCSGARIEHMTNEQDVTPDPDNPPQLDRLHDMTKLVTLQIGGNDIRFSEILRSCSSSESTGTPCRDRYLSGGHDQLSERIAALEPKVHALIAAIEHRAPAATVVVLGYPAILPHAGAGCWPVVPITAGDVGYLRAKHVELNDMLADVAATADVEHVDVYTPSVGHDACQLPGARWVEPAVPASPAAPYHPNLLGMHGVASALDAAIDDG